MKKYEIGARHIADNVLYSITVRAYTQALTQYSIHNSVYTMERGGKNERAYSSTGQSFSGAGRA